MSDQESTPPPTGTPDSPGAPDSRAFGRLLQGLASEMNLLGHGFAAAHGLHATDVQALLAILRGSTGVTGPATPGRLREELALTSGAVTAVLDRLERAGHIRRSRDGADRRQVRLHYNPGASRMAAEWFGPVAACTDAVAAEFDADELRTVARFLDRMTTGLEELRHTRREGAAADLPAAAGLPRGEDGHVARAAAAGKARSGAADADADAGAGDSDPEPPIRI
ncbi:MarR family winged helix-turn-helix transcriptional regulator [Kitasatospora sp. NBC_01539]|uniref:MarR family winged helix-turn-helix transcriptional regulator n=1 Tax=Kitasatospora sp. NBC_01539 TaxID=2903577 RepID=UPI0038602008